jgi:tripartite-type tricarboxylate transporter receptor subunit TctC
MRRMRLVWLAACMGLLAPLGVGVHAQSNTTFPPQPYPSRPIRVIAPSFGGTADFVARSIAQGLTTNLGQQVIVDNRNNDMTPIEIVMKSAPDGHTLLIYGTLVWLLPYLRDDVRFDPIRDLAPISLTNKAPGVLVAHQGFAAKSVQELIALARAKPGVLNYATTATGNATHIAGELFKSMAGVNIVRVNYRATATAVSELISGQVQLMFGTAGTVAPQLKAGRLTALAVTSAQPSALFPGLPTIAASGLPGYESVQMNGVWAPVKTPAALINRLNAEIVRVLNQADTRETFFNLRVEPVGSSPAEFVATMKSEMTRLGKVIRDAGIRDE